MATLQEIETALRNADAAGDTEAAKTLANAYRAAQTRAAGATPNASATEGMGLGEKMLAGFGQGLTNMGRGAGQMLGLVDQASVDEARKLDKPLMQTGGGMAGAIGANLVSAVLPGASTMKGAALIGGGLSALQPTAEGESRLANTAIGTGLGAAGQYGANKLGQFVTNRLASKEAAGALQASQNAVKDATLKASQEAGYVVPPSQSGAGVVGRVLEGVSGKYKTNQLAGIKNQNVTDTLARKALGLPEDAALTSEAMQGIRAAAFDAGYAPIAKVGTIKVGPEYEQALNRIVEARQGAAKSFPDAVKNEVSAFVEGLRVPQFDAGDAINMTRILREDAGKAFASGDKALGKAMREASDAIEGQIERHLAAQGKNGADALQKFRDARTLMAKSHSVEQALVEGGGQVNAKVLGAALQRGKPLSGELKTIGAFANNFKDVSGVPKSGHANPLTVIDTGYSLGMAPFNPVAASLPLARVGARYGILSGAGQKAMAQPAYGPGLMDKLPANLSKEEAKRLLGLLGPSVYVGQQ